MVRLGPIGTTESVQDKRRVVARMAPPVAEEFFPYPAYFVAVVDASMDRLGIHPGDRVAVREDEEPEDGQVVVARLDHEFVLRRYRKASEGQVELRPESMSERHPTITVDLARTALRTEGVMVGALIGTRPV